MTASDARFVAVYERYYRNIYAYCRRRLSAERVDDAVAETFLTAWRRIDALPEGGEALPWLYSVAYGVLRHQWRSGSRQKRLRSKLASLGVAPVTSPDDYIVRNEDSGRVLEALGGLGAHDQEILRLAIWEELRQDDIAAVLDINKTAVKKRLSRARQRLTREYVRLEGKTKGSPAAQEGGAW